MSANTATIERSGLTRGRRSIKYQPNPTAVRRIEADSRLFAARIRAARAVLGWTQTDLGKKARITQRAIYRLEKAAVKPRHLTQVRINKAFEDAGIGFAELPNGGFEMIVRGQLLTAPPRTAEPQN